MSELSQKVSALRALLHDLKRVVVCFSGGVDSGYLVAESFAALGKEALALTAVSPSLAPEEGVHAQRLAIERRGPPDFHVLGSVCFFVYFV